MKIRITYINENVTQILEVINQDDYNIYSKLSEKEKNAHPYKALFKSGKACTTGSPIFETYLRGDGKLILPHVTIDAETELYDK